MQVGLLVELLKQAGYQAQAWTSSPQVSAKKAGRFSVMEACRFIDENELQGLVRLSKDVTIGGFVFEIIA